DQLSRGGAAGLEIVGQGGKRRGLTHVKFSPSWPGLSRPSTSSFYGQDVDARHKAGHDELWIKIAVNVEIEQRRAQRFAVRVERQRPRHAATERLVHDKIQCRDIGQLVAHYVAFDYASKMRLD